VRLNLFGTPVITEPIIPAPDDEDDTSVQQLLEREMVGETEVLRENISQCQVSHYVKSSKYAQKHDSDVCGNMDTPVLDYATYGSTPIKNS
jgi:hypothetical protein